MVQCSDGLYSHSGGYNGVCFFHGGVLRTVYQRRTEPPGAEFAVGP